MQRGRLEKDKPLTELIYKCDDIDEILMTQK